MSLKRILSLRSALLVAAIGALSLTIAALGAPASTQLAAAAASIPPKRLLVIAVDGLGWEAFELAQRRGMFKRFRFAGRHVAPYPSMSHPSWNEVVGARRVFGARGNAHTIEARWFDLNAMRVADDPRQVIARQTSPYAYQRVWDYFFDPLIEPLQYLPGRKLFDRELAEAERAILEEFKGDRFIAYVGGLDAMAHTHRNELWPYLQRFDAMVSRVVDSLAARGDEPELWLVSDHGNAGGFAEGAPEQYLTTVSLDRAIKRAGLTKSDTGRLERPDQVAVVTIALATMVNVYFADMSRRRALAASALAEPGVEMATWLEVNEADRYVVILTATGEARLRWRRSTYSYERIRGNPLLIPDSLTSEAGTRRWIPDPVMRAATVWGPYPDAPFRLMQSAIKQVENAPDLIVNLRDGFAYKGDLGRFVRMVRTHGSLNARPSLGVIATSARLVPTHVRSEEVSGVIGITPESLFARVASLQPEAATPLARAQRAASGTRWVHTGKDDESYDMRFLRRARPLALSLDYFQKDAMRSLLDALSSEGKASRLSRSRDIVRRADVITGIANNVDTLLALADSLDARAISGRIRLAEQRVSEIPALAPLADLRAVWEGEHRGKPSNGVGRGAAVRRGAMAMWTLPYFLDAALAAPEWDSIPDTRDARFALQWRGGGGGGLRDKVVADPERLLNDTTLAPRLFAEAFAERKLSRAVEPSTLSLLYDPDVSNVTVVYVPGIYDELFDHEIWSRGMRSLGDRLGVRTVTIPVDGRCSSTINADHIVASLRDDTRRRLERGYETPRYLILGYSKGGIDATEALARAPDLAREQVAALVSIAAPHRGTAVAERSDVPGAVMKWTVASPKPVACDTSTASQSLWPATRAAFWVAQKGGRSLAPLTRYFSVSFVAEADRSHPWMKVTKQIGQFREANDGVVPLSSSRFPAPMHAVNLGVIEADHIAGRLASDFPQDAFFQAIVVAVAELGALEPAAAQQWRHMIAAREGSVWRGLRRWYAGSDDAERVPAFPASLRAASALPGGGTGWTADRTFRMGNVEDFADVPVREMTSSRHPNGLRLRCDQRNMQALRREYEFYYDAGNGGSENDPTNGFSIVAAPGRAGERACLLATQASLMKMTTVAYRFRPRDFPSLRIRLRVEHGVRGVDVGKTGLGQNDATFKLWFILRDTRPAAAGRVVLLAYSWASPNTRGHVPVAGSLYEARSSRRNVVLTTLPEAWVVAIGGPRVEGDWHTVEQDLARDLARAYPQIPLGALQVVGITVQADSDDSRGASKVYLESLDIVTRPTAGRMALVKGAM